MGFIAISHSYTCIFTCGGGRISSYWDGKICCAIMKRQDGYFLTISKHTIFRWVIYFNHSLIVCAHLCKSSCMRDTELTYTFLVNRLMKYPTFKDMKLCYILGKGWVDLCFLREIRKRYSPIIRLAVYHIVCITHAKAFFPSRIFGEHIYQTEAVRVLASSWYDVRPEKPQASLRIHRWTVICLKWNLFRWNVMDLAYRILTEL